MTNVLILGANGQLARNTTRYLLEHTAARLRLYLRRASRLKNPDAQRVEIVEGDVLDRPLSVPHCRARTWFLPAWSAPWPNRRDPS